jgi:hypothetical protein
LDEVGSTHRRGGDDIFMRLGAGQFDHQRQLRIGHSTTADNWTLVGTVVPSTAAAHPTATGTSPYGARFLAFNQGSDTPGGNATQDIAALDGSTTYELTFAYGALGTSGSQTLQLTINTTSAPLPAETYTVMTPVNNLATVWQRATYDFQGTLNQVPSGVTFADTGVNLTGDADLVVDDVALVALPEPTALGTLTLAGLGLLGVRRRSRRLCY